MQFIPTPLEDVWLIELERISDSRGFFARSFCEHEFGERGLKHSFPQHSVSYSRLRGTLRGMHFQDAPHGETKLVTCISGGIFDVVVDLRPRSATYRRWAAFELSASDYRRLYIPNGLAHGFQTLSDEVAVSYMIDSFHVPGAAAGFRYDDPRIGIDWPLPVSSISERDETWPPLPDMKPA